MCFCVAEPKGFSLLRNQSKCTVGETVAALNQSRVKNTGSAILKGFQQLPATVASKHLTIQFFMLNVLWVCFFFLIVYPKNIFLYPPHPFHERYKTLLTRIIVPTEVVSCKVGRGKAVARESVLCRETVQTTFLDECSTNQQKLKTMLMQSSVAGKGSVEGVYYAGRISRGSGQRTSHAFSFGTAVRLLTHHFPRLVLRFA